VTVEMDTVTRADVSKAALARHSFRSYTDFVHGWVPRPHQEIWFTALQALAEGRLKSGLWVNGVAMTLAEDREPTTKLMIVAPPAAGKSDTANEYMGWTIGRALMKGQTPQAGIVAYGDEPATDRSVAIRDNIAFNDAYRLVFPLAVPDKAKGWSGHSWFLQRADPGKKDPTLRAAGIEGGILSYRFPTIILIDDPHDRRTVESQMQKDSVWKTWQSTIRTRGQAEITPIVLICTRWADDDLAGRLMDVEGDWCIIRTTALVPEDAEEGDQETYWPAEITDRGDPVGISTAALLKLRVQMGEDFPTQYMASPPSLTGDLFRWWTYCTEPAVQEVERVYQFWDTAFNETKRSAYNVMVEMWKLLDGRVYIARVFREKMEMPRLLKKAVELYQETATRFTESKVLAIVEGKASGHSLVQMLRGVFPIDARDIPQQDLRDRAKLISPWFESRHVLLPAGWAPWKELYEKELRGYPRTQYTDQVAATVLGIEYLYPREARGRPVPDRNYYWEN